MKLKMPPKKKEEKSKEEVMAEREAKKAEKAAKKTAAKGWVCLIQSLEQKNDLSFWIPCSPDNMSPDDMTFVI